MIRRNIPLGLAFLWFGAFATLSFAVFHLKLQGLHFHTRDFPFYVASFARLFSAELSKELALNPEGYNLFGFRGTDGYPNVYFDIHISPIKYALSLLYGIGQSLYVLFGAYLILFLAAIAYFIRAFWSDDPREQAFVLICAGALVLLPSAYAYITYDLRVYVLILPFLLMLVAGLDRRRPATDLLLIAIFGLLIREEAALILLLAAIYLHLDSRPLLARLLFGLAVIYIAAAYAYYGLYTDFTYSVRSSTATQAGLLLLSLVYTGLALGARSGRFAWAQSLFLRLRPLAVALFAMPFAAQFVLLNGADVKALDIPVLAARLISGASWYPGLALGIVLALIVTLAVWPGSPRPVRAAIGAAAVAVLAVLAVFTAQALAGVFAMGTERQAVWQVAERLRAAPGLVVVDHALHQAFFDRDGILVWERLPSALAQGDGRFYPHSREALTTIVAETAAYTVLSEPSFGPLLGVLADAGLSDEFEPCLGVADVVVARRIDWTPTCAELGLTDSAFTADEAAGRRLRAQVRLALGQHDVAIQELQMLAAEAESAPNLTALARALVLAGRPEEARETMQRAMRLVDRPTAAQLYLLALSLFAQGQYEASVVQLESALRRDRRHLGAHALSVAARGHLGQADATAKALRALSGALRTTGRFPYSLEEARLEPRFVRVEDSQRFLEGLRKAGVPEVSRRMR